MWHPTALRTPTFASQAIQLAEMVFEGSRLPNSIGWHSIETWPSFRELFRRAESVFIRGYWCQEIASSLGIIQQRDSIPLAMLAGLCDAHDPVVFAAELEWIHLIRPDGTRARAFTIGGQFHRTVQRTSRPPFDPPPKAPPALPGPPGRRHLPRGSLH